MKAVLLNQSAELAIVEHAREFGIPITTFEGLVLLGKHAIRVFGVENPNRVSFDKLCEVICKFLDTPWGFKILKEVLSKEV